MTNIPNILIENIFDKLKLEFEVLPSLKKEKFYAEELLKKSNSLSSFSTSSVFEIDQVYKEEDFLVVYIISISFLKANTVVHISDTAGNIRNFYNSGSVGLIGKQKKKREIALVRLINMIVKECSYVATNPVAIHLNNVRSHKRLILNKIKRFFYVKIVKSFNKLPFNGCRNKKIRRKKYSKRVLK